MYTGIDGGLTCRYTFPCDDQALYTQDIPVQEAHRFEDATFALHRIGLPLGAPILKHLVHEDSLDDFDLVNLSFEIFDCFDEVTGMNDAVSFKGTLPVRNILEETKFNAREWEEVRLIQGALIRSTNRYTKQSLTFKMCADCLHGYLSVCARTGVCFPKSI